MTDLLGTVEAVAATVAALSAVAAVGWKPLMGRHDARSKARIMDDLFLHGAPAVPGVRDALVPAGVRLTGVETGLAAANGKLDGHGRMLRGLTSDVAAVSTNVEAVIAEVRSNGGNSLADVVGRIEDTQARVAADRAAHATTEEALLAEHGTKLGEIAAEQHKVADALAIRDEEGMAP